jgi:predicted permease
MSDFRYALRGLRRTPVSGAVIVLLLALGIGANTIMFSLIDALLLRPLPVQRPQELVQLMHLGGIVYPEFPSEFCRLMRESTPDAFSEVACEGELDVAFAEGANIERVHVGFVSPNYFTMLGVGALYGQMPVRSDEAVVSYGFWQRWFASDPKLLGRKVLIDGHPFNVVGVLPRGFNGIQADTGPDVRITQSGEEALSPDPDRDASPWVFGRLRSGATLAQATAQAQVVLKAADLEMKARRPAFELDDKLQSVSIATGASALRERFSGALILLMAGVILLLLIVCANVGGLMLARSAARRRETAVRIAVGATRGRLLRQVATESAVLVMLGGVLGSALAYAAMPLVIRAMPPIRDRAAVSHPLLLDISPDLRILAFTLGLCAVAAFLFALAPADMSASVDVNETLKATRSSPRTARSWSILVAAQVALCTILLLGAGLLVRTLRQLRSLDAGFDAQHVVTFSLEPQMTGYSPENGRSLEERLLEQVRTLPGVVSASYAARGLMRGTGVKSTLLPTGRQSGPGDALNTSMNWVSPDYFDTMGIRILAGHGFTGREAATPPTPIVVNQALTRRFFPDRDPIGQHLGGIDPSKPAFEIIGVASDAKYRSLREEIPPTLYMAEVRSNRATILHVRTATDPSAIINAVRGGLRSLDARLPFYEIHTLQEEVDASLWQERLVAALSSIFGGIAAVLAGVGLYGMLAHAVSQRKREIGIRMALGALPGAVARLVSWQAMTPVIAGAVAGLAAFAVAARWIANLLYGVRPADPFTILLSVAFVAAVAIAAITVPAWQAMGVDPARALREE